MELETPRLLLRPPVAEDLSGFVAFSADPHSMAFLGGVKHPTIAWRHLATMIGAWTMGPAAMFSVIEKSSVTWLGRVGPWTPYQWPAKEVGWGIRRDFEGMGYALEAAVASIDFAFSELNWERVDHLIAADNLGSRRLAERLGSTLGRTSAVPGFPDEDPVGIWGQTREFWQSHRARFDDLVPR